jgi:quinolinate synthase
MESKSDIINRLKKERNAIILAHYYQDGEIQDVADFLGDSLALAQAAKSTDADVIVFAGVKFMAETAKILNPGKAVLLPDMEAGCSLADNTPADEFRAWIDEHPGHTVISYINCSTEVKAMSDIICTSSNAVKIVESLPKDEKILFAPDQYLGRHVMNVTGREMVLWDGWCEVHTVFSELELKELMKKYPDAEVLAHPECPENILRYADFIGSTSQIIKKAKESGGEDFIVMTEPGIIHEMKKRTKGKSFYSVPNIFGCSCNECPYMKLITIDKIILSLERMEPQIYVDEELGRMALKPIERMLKLS